MIFLSLYLKKKTVADPFFLKELPPQKKHFKTDPFYLKCFPCRQISKWIGKTSTQNKKKEKGEARISSPPPSHESYPKI